MIQVGLCGNALLQPRNRRHLIFETIGRALSFESTDLRALVYEDKKYNSAGLHSDSLTFHDFGGVLEFDIY
jgi:hypothetical protein